MDAFGTKTFTGHFDPSPLELQAFKVMEEAGELQQAAKKIDDVDGNFWTREDRVAEIEREAADVIQATLNLLAMLGFEEEKRVRDIMHDCRSRNRCRGRCE